MRRTGVNLLDVLLPATCLVCGATISPDERRPDKRPRGVAVCANCRESCLPEAPRHACPVCSIPLPRFVECCERCRREAFAFRRVIALHRYDGVPAELVRAYKFGRHRSLAHLIGETLAPTIAGNSPREAAIVPVPSRRRSVRARGFAGADLIALAAGRCSGRAVVPLLAMSAKNAQKTLAYAARRDNARRAVFVRAPARVPASVVLVDDVLTTGTTADACARALLEAGAREVLAVTFAIEY
ncbi:MAG: ComF family protein [Spirochaetota bacterium]